MASTILEDPDGRPVTAKGTVDGFMRVNVEGGGGGDVAATTGALVRLALTAATTAQFPALASPRGFVVKVPSAATASVFFGYDISVSDTGANLGFEVEAGGEFISELDDTSKLYAFSTDATTIVASVESP
jgi:hypothetical protein